MRERGRKVVEDLKNEEGHEGRKKENERREKKEKR